jgi:hypothetical protein
MSPLHTVRVLVLLALVALTGCQSARVINKDAYGGVVAIPENSNTWPFYYHDKAVALIKKECPDYVIVREEEVVTGKMLTTRDSTETRNQDLTPRNSRLAATATTTDTAHTTETRDRTEFRIYFRKREAAPPGVANATWNSVPGMGGPPIQRVSSSMPEPVPVGTTQFGGPLPPNPVPVPQRGYP